ncbi:hypothetical protein KIN20_033436 [Parelaphostrongylus tenuis]|uniref:Uncharacterized protein n=1 Tax=Parelaphostrongylus tenuis TaxID=148309 RepID=A0AAD5R8N4_PARTN|nr:hypothetical protein KIN20_033436 [Parelaphostrongylus tenuis]
MQRRRTHSVNLPTTDHDCYDPELKLERIISHLSYLRINVDEIVLPEQNPLIERLFNEGSLYGFNLEYQFPCLENISRSLKTPIRIPAKTFTMTSIQFRHKRIVLLQMTPNTVPPWNQHNLIIRLHIQLNTHGKFSTRLLGYCVVPLAELLIPPFMICRDFNFIPAKGMKFEGSSLIRIDLGSREKKLMEKLNEMRDPLLESTQVVDATSSLKRQPVDDLHRSRSASHSSRTSENEPPTAKQRGPSLHGSMKNLPMHTLASNEIAPTNKAEPFHERAASNLTDSL